MSTPPRSRLFDSANHHLDDPTVLQAGIDLELNGLPADHAFHDLSHTGIPLVSDVAVLAHVRERGESYRPEQSRIFLEKGLEFFIGLIPGPPPENGADSGPGTLRPVQLLGVESCPQRFGLRRPDLQVRIGGKADRVGLDTEYLSRGAKYRQARNYNASYQRLAPSGLRSKIQLNMRSMSASAWAVG